ncbi:MAG: A/G-specific adenine glycosylase [Reyranellaceae bacterium]
MPDIAPGLLAWYDRHRRTLPWRASPGETGDPYRVWLSEIMLQQTTVATVGPYFARFLERWPDVRALADAPLDHVLQQWAGLGYYARARNLHKCAVVVARDLGGVFPDTEEGLQRLPGVGAYTAAAIAAIAFGRSANVVDGNVERVMARLHAEETPLPHAKPRLKALAAQHVPQERAGDYAQALMDLGATICTPRKPKCVICPLVDVCVARRLGIQETFPRRTQKAEKPTRYGMAFVLQRADGAILLRRREERGLLGGMMEVPSSDWLTRIQPPQELMAAAPVDAGWTELPGVVRHTFTHFHLELRVVAAIARSRAKTDGDFVPLDALGGQALPSVMRKVLDHAMMHLARPPSLRSA